MLIKVSSMTCHVQPQQELLAPPPPPALRLTKDREDHPSRNQASSSGPGLESQNKSYTNGSFKSQVSQTHMHPNMYTPRVQEGILEHNQSRS